MTHAYDIIIIGGGAAGLMAAYGARTAVDNARPSVLVLEKMPRPGRKIMITGKGRCNFTNVKPWSDFSRHVRTNANVLKPSFYNLTPENLIDLFNAGGLESVVERGDRAFPVSHKSMDVVDALADAALKAGARIDTGAEATDIQNVDKDGDITFTIQTSAGRTYTAKRVILATGGLSYPSTGSTGDGYKFAESLGHSIKQCFPSLTALVPKGYKLIPDGYRPDMKCHLDRSLPLSETGEALCGNSLKNVGVHLSVNGTEVQEMDGDIDFTDGGIEGPAGFSVSRNAVKALVNGGKVRLSVDTKPGVDETEFAARVGSLWKQVLEDPRSKGKPARQTVKILLGKLLPWEMIPGFLKCNPEIIAGPKGKETLKMKVLVNALRRWEFDIDGYVGYERCVITAGGVSCDEIVPKTLASRKCPGLYLCGEVLDIDADTGGYNLHIAFSTGMLAGRSAAMSLKS